MTDEHQNAGESRLRVGLLLDSFDQPRWIATVIEEIAGSPYAELVLAVKNEAVLYPRPRTYTSRLRNIRRSLFYQLYTRVDNWLFPGKPDAFEVVDIKPLLADVPVCRVVPHMKRFSDYFDDAAIDAILQYRLDVALRFGFRILKGRALTIARHGVWSYHHGDNLVNRGGPPGYWEVMDRMPVSGSILQILTEELDNGKAIYRSWAATDNYSVRRNRQNVYWKSAAFVGRKLRELHQAGSSALADPLGECYTTYSNRLYRSPTNREMLRSLPALATRYARTKLGEKLTTEQWFLAYKFHAQADEHSNVPDATLYNFKRLTPPPDRFWADPFPVHRDGRHFVFFEEFPYAVDRGHISVLELDSSAGAGRPSPALTRDYHLSFPFLLEWERSLYMIPETRAAGRIELYRERRFPGDWELHSVLLDDVRAADPVIVLIGDRWWMFVSIREPGATSWDELHLYYADSLMGPWRPHCRNPVKSDVRGARPAGRVFEMNGSFYRPAQDCSRRYGYGISVNQIVRITTTCYVEKEVARLLPEWSPDVVATHTINAAGGLTVIDGMARRRRWSKTL